jgi:acetate kinase
VAPLTTGSVPVLVLNTGSSSLKATVLDPPDRSVLAATSVDLGDDVTRGQDPVGAVARALDHLGVAGVDVARIGSVGHRVVHGGVRFAGPTVVDDGVLAAIEDLAVLAPLHNAVAAATIRAAQDALPGATHVAVFDTAFHATLPSEAIAYAVPQSWARDWGIRRFGFHGLAVEWASRRTAELLGRAPAELRIAVAHLGSGCSVTAVEGGRSVDTSMGMTPLEGLVMGTRAGSLDPGILLALLRDGRRSLVELTDDLDHRSGLLGLSGRSADVRELLEAETRGDSAARLALAVFVRRAAAGVAAAATALSGLDAVTFSGGIGENSAVIRGRIAERLGVLGVRRLPKEPSDADAGGTASDRVIDQREGRPAIVRVAAREDVVIAEAVVNLLG